MNKFFVFCISTILFLLCTPALASVSVNGEFVAGQPCEAYASMRKQTNPGDERLVVDQHYSLLEFNKSEPTWYRIKIEGASPTQRWVSATCGQVRVDEQRAASQVSSCNTPGLADGYKLALSWHPAFCETKPDKPECRSDDKTAYHAGNFTLHGLWPNKNSCGIRYEFCGEVKQTRRPFCKYPALTLSDERRIELGRVMPSAAHNSCLQRHEWHKHGTCQLQWDADQYYDYSIRLTQEFNTSGVAQWMQKNIGRQVRAREFFNVVDASLGKGASQRLQLKCKKGNLVDVYIQLPKDLAEEHSLSYLMSLAAVDHGNNCGDGFRIDPIGLGN